MSLARAHRDALCATAESLGPDAPTLCAPWRTADLLAHLVARERRPDAVLGVRGGPLCGYADRVRARLSDRPFAELLHLVGQGPPRWSPTRLPWLDHAANTVEFVIHHEDLRRAAPGWPTAPVDEATGGALWAVLRATGRVYYRRAPVGVVLVAPGFGRAAVHGPGPAPGRSVVLTGSPLELLLHASGRERVAAVEVTGEPEDVARLAAGRAA